MRCLRHLASLAVILVILLAASASRAQDDPSLETGLKPFGSYHGGNIDTVDL